MLKDTLLKSLEKSGLSKSLTLAAFILVAFGLGGCQEPTSQSQTTQKDEIELSKPADSLTAGTPSTRTPSTAGKSEQREKAGAVYNEQKDYRGAARAESQTVAYQTLHVNAASSSASDSNNGSASSPLKTISAAAAMAQPGTEILVYPGIYREEIDITTSGTEEAPIVFRSKEPYQAIVSGSDELTQWNAEGDNLYSYKIPNLQLGWDNHFFRTQWLYMDGEPLRRWELSSVEFLAKTDLGTTPIAHPYQKVDEPSELHEMTFMVNPDTSMLYLKLPDGVKPEDHFFELARREGLFQAPKDAYADHIEIRDFTITHNAGWWRGEGSITISGSDWKVVGNRITWSSSAGLLLHRSNNILIEDNEILWSGQIGARAESTGKLIFRNNRIAFSNWVPYDANWEGGSTKFTTIIDSVFEGNTLEFAHGGGIWFDVYGSSSLIKDNISHNHTGMGLFSELSWLDTYIGNVCYRNRWGLVIGQSQATYFKHNVAFENEIGMQLFGGYRRKSFMNNEGLVDKYVGRIAKIPDISERRRELYKANIKRYWSFLPKLPLLVNVFEENMIFDNNFNVDEDRNFARDKGLIEIWHNNFSENNIYWHDQEDHLFVSISARNDKVFKERGVAGPYQYSGFEEWKKLSGKDSTSVLADPRSSTFDTPAWAKKFEKHWEEERMPFRDTYYLFSDYKVTPTANSTVFGSRIANAPRKMAFDVGDERIQAFVIEHEGEAVLAMYMSEKYIKDPSLRVRVTPNNRNAVIETAFLNKKEVELEGGSFEMLVNYYPVYVRNIDPNALKVEVID